MSMNLILVLIFFYTSFNYNKVIIIFLKKNVFLWIFLEIISNKNGSSDLASLN